MHSDTVLFRETTAVMHESSVGAVLRNEKFILVFYVGIYTGHLCCIVKLPDEVCICHTKRVGQNKSFYNCKSLQTCCSLVLSKKFFDIAVCSQILTPSGQLLIY